MKSCAGASRQRGSRARLAAVGIGTWKKSTSVSTERQARRGSCCARWPRGSNPARITPREGLAFLTSGHHRGVRRRRSSPRSRRRSHAAAGPRPGARAVRERPARAALGDFLALRSRMRASTSARPLRSCRTLRGLPQACAPWIRIARKLARRGSPITRKLCRRGHERVQLRPAAPDAMGPRVPSRRRWQSNPPPGTWRRGTGIARDMRSGSFGVGDRLEHHRLRFDGTADLGCGWRPWMPKSSGWLSYSRTCHRAARPPVCRAKRDFSIRRWPRPPARARRRAPAARGPGCREVGMEHSPSARRARRPDWSAAREVEQLRTPISRRTGRHLHCRV